MQRRTFLKTSLAASAFLCGPALIAETGRPKSYPVLENVTFPEKVPLIVHSDRPPLLESPRSVFTDAITPNNAFFVRWHSPKVPLKIDLETFRIRLHGDIENPRYISVDDLKTKYTPVTVTAALQCGGNSRSAFSPTTAGIQWGSGAMGCAVWKGVCLKELLAEAVPDKSAKWVRFHGMDKTAFDKTPRLVRELSIDDIDDNIIVAYEMNGEAMPLLNGYPVRLIIPGSYSDSWVKMLSDITVSKQRSPLYYMDTAYRIPDNDCECETPEQPAKKTKPITTMNVKSLIGAPADGMKFAHGERIEVRGIAFDGGHGIRSVLVSIDGGKSWKEASLEKALSPFAFRAFRYTPESLPKGRTSILVRAVNTAGQTQPFPEAIRWNHGGYKYNGIDRVTIEVV